MMVFISNGKKLYVSAYSGYLQVLTAFLLNEFFLILHLPNRKDPHPATYKFTDPTDIQPNLA